MTILFGTHSGFVTVTPTTNPLGTAVTMDSWAACTKDTSPAGVATITEVGWWMDAVLTSANYELGLYADDGGIAGTRLYVETGLTTGTTPGWLSTTVNWSISAETPYWIAVQVDAVVGITSLDRQSTGGAGFDRISGATSLADPFGGGTLEDINGHLAIYAIAEAGGASTGPVMQINIGDVWKTVDGVQINIGDVWKTVDAAQINIADTWKASE